MLYKALPHVFCLGLFVADTCLASCDSGDEEFPAHATSLTNSDAEDSDDSKGKEEAENSDSDDSKGKGELDNDDFQFQTSPETMMDLTPEAISELLHVMRNQPRDPQEPEETARLHLQVTEILLCLQPLATWEEAKTKVHSLSINGLDTLAVQLNMLIEQQDQLYDLGNKAIQGFSAELTKREQQCCIEGKKAMDEIARQMAVGKIDAEGSQKKLSQIEQQTKELVEASRTIERMKARMELFSTNIDNNMDVVDLIDKIKMERAIAASLKSMAYMYMDSTTSSKH